MKKIAFTRPRQTMGLLKPRLLQQQLLVEVEVKKLQGWKAPVSLNLWVTHLLFMRASSRRGLRKQGFINASCSSWMGNNRKLKRKMLESCSVKRKSNKTGATQRTFVPNLVWFLPTSNTVRYFQPSAFKKRILTRPFRMFTLGMGREGRISIREIHSAIMM